VLFQNGVTRNTLLRDSHSHRAVRGEKQARVQIAHIVWRSGHEGGGEQLPKSVQ
jgi:hypothetical protein